MRAGIALGSNVGDRLKNMQRARTHVFALPDRVPPFTSSALYETEPVDCAPGTEKFLNAVIEIGFNGEPLALLAALRSIEEGLGRLQQHIRNAPRTIDLDLLYLGGLQIDSRELTLPHPRLHTRRFVLQPLADLRPDLKLPHQIETVAGLLGRLPDPVAVVRIAPQW